MENCMWGGSDLWVLFCSACVKYRAAISAAVYHSYNLHPSWDLAIEDQIPLDWKVAQSWPHVWPRLAELGVFRQQSQMLMEASYELRGPCWAVLCDVAPDVEQVFLS